MQSFDNNQIPYSEEAEQALLGAILLDGSIMEKIISLVSTDDFYIKENRQIFETMLLMQNSGVKIDFVTLIDHLRHNGYYDEDITKKYLVSLTDAVPTTKNAPAYAYIIHDRSKKRSMISVMEELREHAQLSDDDADKLLELVSQRLYELENTGKTKDFASIRDVMKESLERLREMQTNPEAFTGIKFGFPDLDLKLLGINPSDLVFIAARPGMGKTSFVLNIANNIASKTKKEVAVFSLEMSSAQLVERMISSQARVESSVLKTGELKGEDWGKITEAASVLAESRIYINDSSDISVIEMKSMCRKFKSLGLIVIDYLQLMQSGTRKNDNRVAEVSEISRALKIMAKELSVPVICLSQLSRGPESRTDKRPMLSDLRESGSIEQDADIVLMLYREDYYKQDTENKNICEVIVAKNRHGDTGTVKLAWDGRYTRFDSIDWKHPNE